MCAAENMLAFTDEKALGAFMKKNACRNSPWRQWQCPKCGCLHALFPPEDGDGGGRFGFGARMSAFLEARRKEGKWGEV